MLSSQISITDVNIDCRLDESDGSGTFTISTVVAAVPDGKENEPGSGDDHAPTGKMKTALAMSNNFCIEIDSSQLEMKFPDFEGIQRSAKKYATFVKQDPCKAKQSS